MKLAELEESLSKARRQRTVRLYVEGVGFIFREDTKAIEEAEKALSDFTTQQQISEIDKSIDKWNEYKKSWESISKDFQKEQDKLIAIQVLGADYEQKILDQRLDILEDFKNSYLKLQSELLAIQNTVIQVTDSINSSTSTSSSSLTTWIRDLQFIGGLTVKGYASGTRNSKAGVAKVDENLRPELIISPNKGRYTYLEAGSQVMNANLASNIFSMAQNPIKWVKDALLKIPQLNTSKNSPANIISIGDINIYEPVGDSNSFARELNSSLSTRGLQLSFK